MSDCWLNLGQEVSLEKLGQFSLEVRYFIIWGGGGGGEGVSY